MLGVLQARGPYIKLKGGDTIGLGIEATIKELKSNKQLLDKIKKMCYNYLNDEEEAEESTDIAP